MYNIVATVATLPLEFFARAGGGGSGGSGGGGESIFIVFGYVPMHFVGAALRKIGTTNEALKIVTNIIGWVVAVIYSIFWIYVWGGLGFLIGIAALSGMAAGLYNLLSKFKQSKQVKAGLDAAAASDASWSEEALLQHVTNTFYQYQKDWSSGNSKNMQSYLTPAYFAHASLLVYTLQLMGRQDFINDPNLIEATVVDMNDAADNTQDSFIVGITAKANDQLIDTATEERLFVDSKPFTEYWTFQRSGNTWLLAGISQATADPYALNAQLRSFAEQHSYYYSLDMGWLFIPKNGQLFGEAKFGTSDINNHIVGLYNNQLLVQLYSYTKNPQSSTKPYIIAQVNVPRQYGNIVVRHKKTFHLGIKGLEKVQTEWTQFNNKYEVYASSAEQATSFELLNPTYMEQLEALGFEVNIEVVDNVIYLYTDERAATLEIYESMLDLVNKAFKELRF